MYISKGSKMNEDILNQILQKVEDISTNQRNLENSIQAQDQNINKIVGAINQYNQKLTALLQSEFDTFEDFINEVQKEIIEDLHKVKDTLADTTNSQLKKVRKDLALISIKLNTDNTLSSQEIEEQSNRPSLVVGSKNEIDAFNKRQEERAKMADLENKRVELKKEEYELQLKKLNELKTSRREQLAEKLNQDNTELENFSQEDEAKLLVDSFDRAQKEGYVSSGLDINDFLGQMARGEI